MIFNTSTKNKADIFLIVAENVSSHEIETKIGKKKKVNSNIKHQEQTLRDD